MAVTWPYWCGRTEVRFRGGFWWWLLTDIAICEGYVVGFALVAAFEVRDDVRVDKLEDALSNCMQR